MFDSLVLLLKMREMVITMENISRANDRMYLMIVTIVSGAVSYCCSILVASVSVGGANTAVMPLFKISAISS